MNETKVIHNGNVLTLERTFDAPRNKVWAAWTKAEMLEKWWGPNGWETSIKHMEFKPGGHLLYAMKCVDKSQGDWFGKESWGKSQYETINPEDGFAYTDYFCDENGNVTKDMPVAKIEMRFEEVDGKTKMTSITTYNTEEELAKVLEMGMEQGIKETFDRLAQLLQ